jgi:glycosyltransferase involved in cell wall biosynthesis
MVRIAHAPTNRQVKSTALLIEAVERLKAEGLDVELDLIERVPWTQCLERKAKADIYFDQVILGYGCNAIEAWSMGIPVVAGGSDETLDEMERRFGHLPFVHATEETIYDALKELVESSELRERYGQIGLEHVRKWHDASVVVEQLKRLYQRAMERTESKAA